MPTTRRNWWKFVVLALEFYLVLASPVAVLLWNNGDKYDFGFPVVAYLFLGGLFSFVALLISGIILFICHQPKWGMIALTFALFAFLLFGIVLPSLKSM